VDAVCGIFESAVKGAYKQDVANGNLNIFTQIVPDDETSPTFGKATPIMQAIKGERLRAIAKFLFVPSLLARPLAAPPGTPADRVAILRKALMDTEADPEALAAAQKAGLALKPKSGREVDAIMRDVQDVPHDIIQAAYSYTH
jgi:hypothetical protein